MSGFPPAGGLPAARRQEARLLGNQRVSSGLLRLELALERPLEFLPGQFAMLNLGGAAAWVFGRPFSILAAAEDRAAFLYRIVGRGTAALADLAPGAALTLLGPLGTPFPPPAERVPALLIAGGVGLPPLHAWLERWGRPDDTACFGARDGTDVPWDLLDERWRVSVDRQSGLPAGRTARTGLVTELAAHETVAAAGPRLVLACGPWPLLRAAAALARERGWECLLSLEEHMGCGYGVCKGCVVPVRDLAAGPDAARNATCCQEGPVFRAETLAWEMMP